MPPGPSLRYRPRRARRRPPSGGRSRPGGGCPGRPAWAPTARSPGRGRAPRAPWPARPLRASELVAAAGPTARTNPLISAAKRPPSRPSSRRRTTPGPARSGRRGRASSSGAWPPGPPLPRSPGCGRRSPAGHPGRGARSPTTDLVQPRLRRGRPGCPAGQSGHAAPGAAGRHRSHLRRPAVGHLGQHGQAGPHVLAALGVVGDRLALSEPGHRRGPPGHDRWNRSGPTAGVAGSPRPRRCQRARRNARRRCPRPPWRPRHRSAAANAGPPRPVGTSPRVPLRARPCRRPRAPGVPRRRAAEGGPAGRRRQIAGDRRPTDGPSPQVGAVHGEPGGQLDDGGRTSLLGRQVGAGPGLDSAAAAARAASAQPGPGTAAPRFALAGRPRVCPKSGSSTWRLRGAASGQRGRARRRRRTARRQRSANS